MQILSLYESFFYEYFGICMILFEAYNFTDALFIESGGPAIS